jgi:hypothetical protein
MNFIFFKKIISKKYKHGLSNKEKDRKIEI